MLFPALEAMGVPLDRVLEVSPHPLSHLRTPKNRIPWDDLADIIERAGELLASPEALVRVGSVIAVQPAHERLFGITGLVASPQQLYWLMCRYLGNAVFGIVESQLVLSTKRRAVIEMAIPRPYKDSPGFFLLTQGSIAQMPRILGYPPAEVALELGERRARFDITIHPRARGGFLRNLPRKLKLHLSAGRLSEELAQRQDELSRAILDLRAAYVRIEEQKLALERQVVELDRLHAEAERRAAEQRDLDRKVQETQRLESLGLLAGGVAHDFNNLLMAISANQELAQWTLEEEAPAREFLGQIEQAVLRARQLTGQMLAYAGRSQIDLGPIRIQNVLGGLARLLDATLPPNIVLDVHLPDDLPALVADPAQLQQVCMNLVTNAAEAIGERGGRIEVRAAVEWHDPVEGSGPGPRTGPARALRLTVRDSGSGMDRETRARIFDPFYTTRGPGRGLGLAAVAGIVRAHQGTIHLESEPGQGALFSVLLPVYRHADALPDTAVADSSDAPIASHRGVLVVDDEPAVLNTSAELLRRHGFAVQTAANGEQALSVVEQDPAAVDVVLLDLTMPGMRSDEVYRRIRKRWPRIRIVLSSGYDIRDSARRLGDQDTETFLQKPYSARVLIDAISKA